MVLNMFMSRTMIAVGYIMQFVLTPFMYYLLFLIIDR